jgi:3-oxoacyl-(acyl-carrier-protein) synthase
LQTDAADTSVERAISKAITHAGVSLDDIGLVLAGAIGLPTVDAAEITGLSRVFAKARELPALGVFSPYLGNLMEAGGVAELAMVPKLYDAASSTLPAPLQAEVAVAAGFKTQIAAGKRVALVVRTTPWGEATCLVTRMI